MYICIYCHIYIARSVIISVHIIFTSSRRANFAYVWVMELSGPKRENLPKLPSEFGESLVWLVVEP